MPKNCRGKGCTNKNIKLATPLAVRGTSASNRNDEHQTCAIDGSTSAASGSRTPQAGTMVFATRLAVGTTSKTSSIAATSGAATQQIETYRRSRWRFNAGGWCSQRVAKNRHAAATIVSTFSENGPRKVQGVASETAGWLASGLVAAVVEVARHGCAARSGKDHFEQNVQRLGRPCLGTATGSLRPGRGLTRALPRSSADLGNPLTAIEVPTL